MEEREERKRAGEGGEMGEGEVQYTTWKTARCVPYIYIGEEYTKC